MILNNDTSPDRPPLSGCHSLLLVLLFSSILLGGCFHSVYTTQEHRNFNLTIEDLREHGIAFITPSSITGQEQDRQALALTFAQVLQEKHPDMRVVTLPETLGALNRAQMLAEYKAMYEDYADTGIFSRPALKKISDLTGTRYLAQLKLSGFQQGSTQRFGAFGLRVLETKRANLRIFLQFWDGREGEIAWEGYEEVFMSSETFTEKGLMFYDAARTIAERMMANIPQNHAGTK
ncbi:MAG TPA: hypothetical protein DDY20_11825 [Desulfobulbaceae bacterium]|nr:hypothetical protein [Desulfobulbaceae bacterium]